MVCSFRAVRERWHWIALDALIYNQDALMLYRRLDKITLMRLGLYINSRHHKGTNCQRAHCAVSPLWWHFYWQVHALSVHHAARQLYST